MDTEVKVCAIIVAFYPDPVRFKKILAALVGQVRDVVVVDNSVGSNDSSLEALGSLRLSIHWIRFGQNRGVAAAHNAGIEWAKSRDNTHILLLDHDSVPAPDMVPRLMKAARDLEHRGVRLAAVGPKYINPRTKKTSFFVQFKPFGFNRFRCGESDAVVPVDFLISSGCLIRINTLNDVGNMDEALFIDHIDTEWFIRARVKGYHAFGVCSAAMEHVVGDRVRTSRIFSRDIPEHSPIRHYYTFRNSISLYKRSYVPLRWIVGDLRRLLTMAIFYSLFTQPRITRLSMMAHGIADGMRGKSGARSFGVPK